MRNLGSAYTYRYFQIHSLTSHLASGSTGCMLSRYLVIVSSKLGTGSAGNARWNDHVNGFRPCTAIATGSLFLVKTTEDVCFFEQRTSQNEY